MALQICFITAEMTPFAKAGGLADVSGALVKYLHAAGHDIRLFMPGYSSIKRESLEIYPVEFLQDIAAAHRYARVSLLGADRAPAGLRSHGVPDRLPRDVQP